jgi:glycine cleavage system H protein
VNEKATEEPEVVNEDPYGQGWLIRIRLGNASETRELLDAEAYRGLLAEQ